MRYLLPAALALGLLAHCGLAEPRHGLSAFGDLKYPPDFKHFDYVNPDAPKGGRLASRGILAIDTFDSFNGFILRGNAAQNIELLFDTLMVRANDEPDAVYGLVADSADERHVPTGLRGGDGLVTALTSGRGGKGSAEQRFSRSGESGH